MSAITAKGKQAKETVNRAKKDNIDLKKVLIKLKENQTHKVRILSDEDYVVYASSGDFNMGIYTQAISENSPLIVAYNKGGEKFKNFKPKNRVNFAFASLETGEIMALQVTENQAKTLISSIEEYADNLDNFAFNLKRTGSDTSTVYSLSPIITKLPDKEKEMFDKFEGVEVGMDFYEAVLAPKDDKFLAKLLHECGFDVEKHLPHIDISDSTATAGKTTKAEASDEGKPINISVDELPF